MVNNGNVKAQVFLYLASQFCRLMAVGDKWIPTNRTIVGGHRLHYTLQKVVVFLCNNELERRKKETNLCVEHYVWVYLYIYLEHATTVLRSYESRVENVIKK